MKHHPCNYFQTKDLGKLKYFLGIEVAQSNDDIVISQMKYAFDIFEKTGLMNSNFVDILMDPNTKFLPNQGEPMSNLEQYRRLGGKLNYLTITCLIISFAISVVSQFLNSLYEDHWNAIIHISKYIKGSPRKGLFYGSNNHTRVVCYSDVDCTRSPSDIGSIFEYCVSFSSNLISWKNKK